MFSAFIIHLPIGFGVSIALYISGELTRIKPALAALADRLV